MKKATFVAGLFLLGALAFAVFTEGCGPLPPCDPSQHYEWPDPCAAKPAPSAKDGGK